MLGWLQQIFGCLNFEEFYYKTPFLVKDLFLLCQFCSATIKLAIISLPLELATCRLSELDLHIDFFLIYRFGSDKVKREFLAPSITGDRVSCLGVSEAGAGSDVASKVVIYTSLLLKSDITNEPNYHNDPKFLDRQVWADILDGLVGLFGTTLKFYDIQSPKTKLLCHPKMWTRWPYYWVMCSKDADTRQNGNQCRL